MNFTEKPLLVPLNNEKNKSNEEKKRKMNEMFTANCFFNKVFSLLEITQNNKRRM